MESQEFYQLWNNADYKFRLALVIIDYFNKFEKHIIPTDEFISVLLRNIEPMFVDYRMNNGLFQNLKDAGFIKDNDSYSDEINAFSLTQSGVNVIFFNQKKISNFIEENKIDLTVLPKFVHFTK